MRIQLMICAVAVCLYACEDGPKQVFQPNTGDPAIQNGGSGTAWTQDGDKEFDTGVADDSQGRAKFCDETMAQELIEWMVSQPIHPDVSAGGIPLWDDQGAPMNADALLGVPNPRAADGSWNPGTFCDPWGVYSNALTWGPLNDIIVFFEPETRLITTVEVGGQYLGTLTGNVTIDGAAQPVELRLFEEMQLAGEELQNYPDWASNETVTSIYGMIRETFFDAEPLPADFDCVAAKLCDVIFPLGDPITPQPTYLLFQDSGVVLGFSEDGNLQFVDVEPVRIAPFEVAMEISLGDESGVAPALTSLNALLPNCSFALDGTLSWREYRDACTSELTLSRVNYEVSTQRDSVNVGFNGLTLSFLRETSQRGLLADGARPADADLLYGVGFSRSLSATVAEYIPHEIALLYQQKLKATLASALDENAPQNHPFADYNAPIPYDADGTTPLLSTEPSRIGELMTPTGSWVPQVLADVQSTFDGMSPEQRAMVDVRVLGDVSLIEPFVASVLSALSHGGSDQADAFTVFRTADTLRWSIGRSHFMVDGVPYRLMVQYSLYFGAVTYITVERGYSETDALLNNTSSWLTSVMGMPEIPHYELWMSQVDGNPFGLGGDGIRVTGFDRQLETVEVDLVDAFSYYTDEMVTTSMTVAGSPLRDQAGFTRQIQGERYEFIPANEVYLYGKESSLLFFVEADGTIGKIVQPVFKGSMSLCPGLEISYGDDIRRKFMAWEALVGRDAARDCEIVFNYSENGNVLDSVASLREKVSLVTIGGRAVTAAIWR